MLAAFAEHQFSLNRRMADGKTEREHLLAAQMAGVIVPELEAPPLPDWVMYLWDWFVELATRRQSGFSGNAPLSWSDIYAWAQLTGRNPTPFETECLCVIDDAWLAQKVK